MSKKTVQIYEEDVHTAYMHGCEDVQKVLKDLFPSSFKEEKTISIGHKFNYLGNECLLAAIGENEVVVVNINNGTYWGRSINKVDNTRQIKRCEFKDCHEGFLNAMFE
jgi:hypothetical protein